MTTERNTAHPVQPSSELRQAAVLARDALQKLRNEISTLHIEAVREELGNTNAQVLELRVEQAESALAALNTALLSAQEHLLGVEEEAGMDSVHKAASQAGEVHSGLAAPNAPLAEGSAESTCSRSGG